MCQDVPRNKNEKSRELSRIIFPPPSSLALAQMHDQINFIPIDTPNALPLAMSELRNKRITILDISGIAVGIVSV